MGDIATAGTRGSLLVATLLLASVLSTGTAAAFTAGSGFTATTYTNGIGSPAGIAFIGATMFVVDPADGGLYAASGTAPIAATRVGTVGGAPTGLLVQGGALYVTQATAGAVVVVDPATAAIARTVAVPGSIPGASGIAADPVTGDLFVAASDGVYRIQSPTGITPTVSRYTQLYPAQDPAYAIAIGTDDIIWVSVPTANQVWRVQGPSVGLPNPGSALALAAPRGLALVPPYLYVSEGDGTVTKAALPGTGATTLVALTGGAGGDLATLGADGCYYAGEISAVVRIGDASGGCDLVHAGPAPVPTLTLVNTTPSSTPALVGGGQQTFTATLANVASAGGVRVTFTVRGANHVTQTTTTAPNGVADFAYAATKVGTDTIVATADVNGSTIASNSLTLPWPRAKDLAPPTIAYAVAGTPGTNFGCPRAGVGTPGSIAYCGWYTTLPTITWTVTANGPTGIDTVRTSCPPYALVADSPLTGTPVTCIAYNGDGVATSLQVVLQAVATPPTITASATIGVTPYVAGTPTTQDVTVSFACDSAYGAAGVRGCTAPSTVTSATSSISGSVADIAGTVRTVSFGPIVIDRTGPAISAVAALADGTAYAYGSWAREPVTLTFSCDDPSGVASCPAPVTLGTSGSVPASAVDSLGNVSSASFGPVDVDLIAPATAIALDGDLVTLTATDATSGVASIAYTIDGGATVTASGASTSFALAVGTHTVTYAATDVAGNVETAHGATLTVSRVPTSLAIASPAMLATGSRVSATLRSGGGAPIAGAAVTFTAGGSTKTANTDASGVATADLGLAPGSYTLAVTYPGTPAYDPSSARQPLVVYMPTRFVVWAANATPGATVQFYGDDWARQIGDAKARRAVADFKGYAATVSGGYWIGRPGDSVKPPERLPEYIGVVLATTAAAARGGVSGEAAGFAVVRVTRYSGRLGERASGAVVSVAGGQLFPR